MSNKKYKLVYITREELIELYHAGVWVMWTCLVPETNGVVHRSSAHEYYGDGRLPGERDDWDYFLTRVEAEDE